MSKGSTSEPIIIMSLTVIDVFDDYDNMGIFILNNF